MAAPACYTLQKFKLDERGVPLEDAETDVNGQLMIFTGETDEAAYENAVGMARFILEDGPDGVLEGEGYLPVLGILAWDDVSVGEDATGWSCGWVDAELVLHEGNIDEDAELWDRLVPCVVRITRNGSGYGWRCTCGKDSGHTSARKIGLARQRAANHASSHANARVDG